MFCYCCCFWTSSIVFFKDLSKHERLKLFFYSNDYNSVISSCRGVGAVAYAATQTTVLPMKRLIDKQSPIFVILCVLCIFFLFVWRSSNLSMNHFGQQINHSKTFNEAKMRTQQKQR